MPAIRLDGVGKRYRRYLHTRPDTLKGSLLAGWRMLRPVDEFWALRDVSFDVAVGRTAGLIGQNGAGKSTLLRLVAGVGRPDEGRIDVVGRVSALFELGTGFHHELTGRESAITAAVVAGLSRRDARRRLPDIVEFAELGEFIDSPLRTYSTGMQARLAFSIAVHVEPEILIVDEVLSVGDLAFQERCLNRIRQFQDAGATILLVSHDPGLVDDLCDQVVWLRRGEIAMAGEATEVTTSYRRTLEEETRRATPADGPVHTTADGRRLVPGQDRFGTFAATLGSVRLLDGWGAALTSIGSGDGVEVIVLIDAGNDVEHGYVQVLLERDDGLVVLDSSTPWRGAAGASEARLSIDRLDLAAGRYHFSVGIYTHDWETTLDYHWRAYPLVVRGRPSAEEAVVRPPLRWTTS